MKLIVGLGNPGKEYINTRHNIGFMVLDLFAKEKQLEFNKEKFNGKYLEFFYNDEKIILLKPQSFINLSGEVIIQFMHYYSLNVDDIFIIHDDLDLNVGSYKLKATGSSGGHNGLKNIESNLKSRDYKRLKIGISNDKRMETKDYVLGKFSTSDKEKIAEVLEIAIHIIDDYLKKDFNSLMNYYNTKNR